MGRCNNRRTQQAAAELRNTPSRARFSSGPPRKSKGGRNGGGRGAGRGGRTSNNGGRGGGAAAKAAVVEKLSKRVEQKQSTSTSTSTTKIITRRYRHPLANVDITKLDELVLPEESLQEVMRILSDLNVKVVETATQKNSTNTAANEHETDTTSETVVGKGDNRDAAHQPGEPGITFNMDDEDESYADDFSDEHGEGSPSKQPNLRSNGGGGGGGYEEHDEDYNDEEGLAGYVSSRVAAGNSTDATATTIWEDNSEEEEEDNDDNDNDEPTTMLSELEKINLAQEKFRSDPVFVHLTSRLSFKENTALRACQAIEDMVSNEDEENNTDDNDNIATNNNTSNTRDADNNKQQRKRQGEKMAFAMDWLCLHLEEEELTAGFKTNPNMTSPIILMGTGRTKPIPHPSISVAKKITSDRDWKKSILVQEKVMKFLPLGFQNSETYDTFKEYTNERLEQESSKAAIDDDEALRLLLTTLERETLEADGNSTSFDSEQLQKEHTQGDLDYAASEREEEEQALAAIYDDEFQIIKDHDNVSPTPGLYRYKLVITPSEPLKEPARSEKCSLHVFVRPGYPAFEPPLVFFCNPTLPPSLLRRVNMELVRQVHQSLGAPAVFEVVNYLSTELLSLQEDFMKEQRSKEMEAEQLRLRREAGHVIDEVEYGEETKMGRRQRAKLKAAAKAFDQPDVAQQAEKDRLERQDARIERAKVENKNFRQSMAERAIEKREKERQEEEINAVGRAAMSAAFNTGASVDEAREAADKAKLEYMLAHGLIKTLPKKAADDALPATTTDEGGNGDSHPNQPEASGEDDNEDKKENVPVSTPTTAAFMERLREMYAAAAKEKAEGGDISARRPRKGKKQEQELEAYHLNPAQEEVEDEGEELNENVRFPRPVAVPVGELARVMEDVISTQKEQPWLVAPEARAPETGSQFDSQDEPKITQKCRDISRQLKEENERKYKSALDWRRENDGKNGKGSSHRGQKGFTPQSFSNLLSQRERLPAYLMKDSIVSTISSNQVTVVAGDTGCGKVR